MLSGIDVWCSPLEITLTVVSMDSKMVSVAAVAPEFAHEIGIVDMTDLKAGRGETLPMETTLEIGEQLI